LSGPLSAGQVLFAESVLKPDFVNEFIAFPNWAHDDRVDAAGYAVEYLLGRPVVPKMEVDVVGVGKREWA